MSVTAPASATTIAATTTVAATAAATAAAAAAATSAISATAAPSGGSSGGGAGGGSSSGCYSAFLTLQTYLLNSSRYNDILPPYSPSASSNTLSLDVTVTILLIRFVSLTNDQTLNVAGALDMTWRDMQLSWSTASYPCVQNMPFYANTVWHPYVYLQGSATSTIKYSMDDYDLITRSNDDQSNGRIYGTFSSRCAMTFTWFPFDTQTCSQYFLNYDMSYINWILKSDTVLSIGSENATSTSDWTVISMSANTTITSVYVGGSWAPTSSFYATYVLQRKTLYYTINVLAPTVVMWVMIALTFVLPTDRGMKVPLTVTLMLAIYTQQKNVSSLLPATTPVPHIITVLLWGLYLGALSLASAVITVLFRVLAPRLPHGCQVFLINVVGRFCCTPRMNVEPESGAKELDGEFINLHPITVHHEDGEKVRPEITNLLSKLNHIDHSINELVKIKRDKIKKTKLSALNESVWQKMEFLFNAILLLAYCGLMTYFFVIYSINAGANILNTS